MVNSKDIDLLIHLAEQPEKATPMDWDWLHELLKSYPNFDFLLKVYLSVSNQLGIVTEGIEESLANWNNKQGFFQNSNTAKEVRSISEIDKCTTSQRIRLFIANFEAKHAPFSLSELE